MAVGEEYAKVVEPGIENKKAYCERYGYDFYCLDQSLDRARPIPWSKVLYLLDILSENKHSWVFWSDADSLIMNPEIPLEDFIDDRYFLIISQDFNDINSGQFFLRNCSKSRAFLEAVYSHEECIHHPWWENQAVILELSEGKWRDSVKILPQRMFNSYPKGYSSPSSVLYQPGDFILHFAGARQLDAIDVLMKSYGKEVKSRKICSWDFDRYLNMKGFPLLPQLSGHNEGGLALPQQDRLEKRLKDYPHMVHVAEIGFDAGHTAQLFFENCPNLAHLCAFDLGVHPYISAAREYYEKHKDYRDRFHLVIGDSTRSIPLFNRQHPLQKFDLIYFNGRDTYEKCLQDIINCKYLAHPETILWIDDSNSPSIRKALLHAVSMGIIEAEPAYSEDHLMEARYITGL